MEPEILEILIRLNGWVAAGFLVLNFLTCWAMPWAKRCRELVCKVEGVEELPRPLCLYHKWIVWPAIIFSLIHILLAILI